MNNGFKKEFLLLISVVSQAMALMFLKIASSRIAFSYQQALIPVLVSISFLIIQAIVWQQVLKKCDVFLAYIRMALVYPVLLALGVIVFKESITLTALIGVLFIIAGVVVINEK